MWSSPSRSDRGSAAMILPRLTGQEPHAWPTGRRGRDHGVAVLCGSAVLRLVLPGHRLWRHAVGRRGGAGHDPGPDGEDPLRRLGRQEHALELQARGPVDGPCGSARPVLAFYEAHNPTDRVIAGTASFNVFPTRRGLFHQDRVLLLHRAGAATGRNGADAGDFLSTRPWSTTRKGSLCMRSCSAIPSTKRRCRKNRQLLTTPAADAAAVN
jgi:hypothetical protein